MGMGLGKRRKSASKNDHFLDSDDDDDVTYPLPELGNNNRGSFSTSPSKDSAAQTQYQGQGDGEVTGRCATCDSTVRWPKRLSVFRCPVCSMINDLEPYIEEDRLRSGNGDGKAAARTIPRKGSLPDRLDGGGADLTAIPVSVEHTRAMADVCVSTYLNRILVGPESHQLSARLDPFDAEPKEQTRPWIFKQIEEYIVSSFKGGNCLNHSFTSHSSGHPGPPRGKSEQSPSPPPPPPHVDTVSAPHAADPAPAPTPAHTGAIFEPDAKTLLLGDVAENSSWWMNDYARTNGHKRTQSREKPSAPKLVSSRSPRIDWGKLGQWYDTIMTAGNRWKDEWYAMRPTAIADEEDVMRSRRWNSIDMSVIEGEIAEARMHLHKTLLKATENLLKRPRRPLKSPEDIRFLLIILANPLIYPSSAISKAQAVAAAASHRRTASNPQDINKLSPRDVKSSPRKTPPKPSTHRTEGPGRHSAIIKRVLGLLAHLPNECHYCLVSWFSRYQIGHFQQIVELIGAFVTYRLSRQHSRKRSESSKDGNSLIPSFSSAAGNTPAGLHAALNGRAAGKQREQQDRLITYEDDWQVRAAARTMALFFRANIINSPRKSEGNFGQEIKMSGRRGQMIPISSFYNTLLDYSDLVADFETWESRGSKFSFSQYPFFLSIWAKIHIMEHDARRQMEVKAREAFFNSILNHKAVSQYLVLKVRRDCLVEDSLRGVSAVVGSGQEDIKKGLRIDFIGEDGIDAGGLRKEWFLLLVREVFDPEHGEFSVGFC